jgi:gliding motility-associated-like protein
MINKKTIFYLLFLLLSSQFNSKASHIFGGELGYTHISGNTYEITLSLYGDCSGNAYPNLFSAVPNILIYNGVTGYSNINLTPFGTLGLEVTPVCPADINNTKCKGGSLPGIAQFIFKGQVTLSGPSADWTFIFEGNLGVNSGAGRSNAITNIVQGVNASIMKLEATLNNTIGPNNSSIYTTIPTPFFCINIPQQYNQGAIDNDGDDLSFELVSGYDGNGGLVNYSPGYSYLTPIAVAPGTFSFSNTTGQLAFQPNIIQNSLVVNKVIEKRNGVIVGTTMREMTFVILNNCNNQSPIGQLAGNSTGTITAGNTIRLCNTGSTLQFSINSTDPDNQNVNATVSGLPANASYTISGNNTPNVNLNFTWPISAGSPLGSTTFYVTFQDDGCPLSSKQTIAYTVIIEQPINFNSTTQDISCISTNDGQIIINANSTNGALSYSINGSPFQNSNIFNGLTVGTYTVQIKDTQNCSVQLELDINNSPLPEITNVETTHISCYGKQDGIISLSAIPNTITYNYNLFPGAFTNTSGLFNNLSQNNYTIIVNDNKGCADTAFAVILEPQPLAFDIIQITDLSCFKQNGKIVAKSNSLVESKYTLTPGLKVNSTGIFENLNTGYYTLNVRTGDDCTLDTVIYIGVQPQSFFITTTQKDLECFGRGIEGSAKVSTLGGIAPFSYLWSSSPPQTTDEAINLYYGWYTISVTDASGCELKDTLYINPGPCCENIFLPNAFSPNGDGKNDEWRMTTSTGLEIEQFAVFNRYGQKIWTTIDQRRGWDGTHWGKEAEPGTYFYILRYKCLSNGEKYTKKGDFILVK